jgi:hypothetical protein
MTEPKTGLASLELKDAVRLRLTLHDIKSQRTEILPVSPDEAARADRAKESAAKTIEKIIDPSASPEERAQRKHRLIKGPSEFRENRVDPPKPKG